MQKHLTRLIFLSMVAGAILGSILHVGLAAASRHAIGETLELFTELFLRLIKMVTAPLIFATVTAGIAHMSDGTAVAKIGAKVAIWFVAATTVSLLLGLLLANTLQPGASMNLAAPPAGPSVTPVTPLSYHDMVLHFVPTSLFDALSTNAVLQVVVFAIFAGLAIGSLGERAALVLTFADQIAGMMFAIVRYVMVFAPIAVFTAITTIVMDKGPTILFSYARLIGSFYLGIVILTALLLGVGWIFLRGRIVSLMRESRSAILLAFSTASSEAAYPRALDSLIAFGVTPRFASFVLPLGYSLNGDGALMFSTFGVLFIAQAYHVVIPLGEQVTLFLLVMVASKGAAGMPRGALLIIAACLERFHLPQAGLLLLLAVDQVLDMGRTAVNVVGNAVATAVIAKWEGELAPPGAIPPNERG